MTYLSLTGFINSLVDHVVTVTSALLVSEFQ